MAWKQLQHGRVFSDQKTREEQVMSKTNNSFDKEISNSYLSWAKHEEEEENTTVRQWSEQRYQCPTLKKEKHNHLQCDAISIENNSRNPTMIPACWATEFIYAFLYGLKHTHFSFHRNFKRHNLRYINVANNSA